MAHYEGIIGAASEVIKSVDKDELAKCFSVKSDSEDEGVEKVKKKMEMSRDKLSAALYQKGIAIAELESLKGEKALAASAEGFDMVEKSDDQSAPQEKCLSDMFEENFKELKKRVDVKTAKYGTLLVIQERRFGRLETALKVVSHWLAYEKQWIYVRFPPSLLLF